MSVRAVHRETFKICSELLLSSELHFTEIG